MVSEVKQIKGRALPLVGNDIDTDRIIPARFLKCITFDGLGDHAFADDRAALQGSHPFDQPQYQGATILLANDNFGCGSSREHAPQALNRWGITAIVGESFAEIFFGNCIALGLPCVIVAPQDARQLQTLVTQNPQAIVEVDLERMIVSCGDFQANLTMSEGPKQMFVTGLWDATGQLVAQAEKTRSTASRLPYIAWC
jgi:3-isopropylmalate/(R)-2-methylmalate dehydratase small subunit